MILCRQKRVKICFGMKIHEKTIFFLLFLLHSNTLEWTFEYRARLRNANFLPEGVAFSTLFFLTFGSNHADLQNSQAFPEYLSVSLYYYFVYFILARDVHTRRKNINYSQDRKKFMPRGTEWLSMPDTIDDDWEQFT